MELAPKKRPTKNEVVPAKRTNVKAIDRFIATQDNSFIYSIYTLTTSEIKFFMWIVSKINSQEDKAFEESEIPVSEVKKALGHDNENYAYVKQLISKMAKKTFHIEVYVEDSHSNKKTNKPKRKYEEMPFFQLMSYEEGEANIVYKLNSYLSKYLLNLKTNFTQIQFKNIREMGSSYSIRIYNMLMCEISQNRTSLKIEVEKLQDILRVPPSLTRWDHFNKEVLDRAKKDINGYSNISLLDIKTYKTGRKITDIEFIFDYKNNRARICRDVNKKQHYVDMLIKELDEHLVGRNICITKRRRIHEEDKHNIFTIKDRKWYEQDKCIYVVYEQVRSSFYKGQTKPRIGSLSVKSMNDIEKLKLKKERAEGVYHAYIANPQEERKKIKPQSKSDKVNAMLEKAVNKLGFFQRK